MAWLGTNTSTVQWCRPATSNTADDQLVETLDTLSGGRLMGVPSLGEVLAAHGKTLAVLASNSAGTTRLFNHKARTLGHPTISGHFARLRLPDLFSRR
ncbi:hypothetical protein ACVWWR_008885 [Bradyrhizobium sp. LM3.2]